MIEETNKSFDSMYEFGNVDEEEEEGEGLKIEEEDEIGKEVEGESSAPSGEKMAPKIEDDGKAGSEKQEVEFEDILIAPADGKYKNTCSEFTILNV